MSERLLEALRVCVDLGEGVEGVEAAFAEASASEREMFFERLLFEALLMDTFRNVQRSVAVEGAGRGATALRRLMTFRFISAAALAMLAIGLFWIWNARSRYAEPKMSILSPAGETIETKPLRRGERMTVGAGGARLTVGGYCRLAFDPEAEFILRGERGKEAIELVSGRVVCQVTPERGEFAVQTPLGQVKVVGTEFATAVEYPAGKAAENARALVTVSVTSGTVEYEFGARRGMLRAGETQVFSPESRTGKAEEERRAVVEPAAEQTKQANLEDGGAWRREIAKKYPEYITTDKTPNVGGIVRVGWALKDKGKYDEAIQVFEGVVRLFTDPRWSNARANAAYEIGVCYWLKKDLVQARRAFDLALDKYPNERAGGGTLYAQIYLPTILKVDAACARPGERPSPTMQKLQALLPENVLREARAKMGDK